MLTDADLDPELQSFSFASQGPWRFKWKPDTRIVYVFINETARYAMEAIPFKTDDPLTFEAANEVGRRYIRSRAGYGTPGFDKMHRPEIKKSKQELRYITEQETLFSSIAQALASMQQCSEWEATVRLKKVVTEPSDDMGILRAQLSEALKRIVSE